MGRGYTRRELMQAGIAGVSFLALGPRVKDKAPVSLPVMDQSRKVSLYTGRDFPAVPTTCRMCPAGCGIVVFIDGTEVVGVQGNPEHPYNRGRICALGSAGVNLFSDPQRIRRPLLRIGARGEANWREVSWEEALGEIASRLKRMRTGDGRSGRFAFIAPGEEVSPFLKRFLHTLGDWCVLVESGGQERAIEEEAHREIWGAGTGVADVSHADLILNFGANLLGSPRHLVGFSLRWIEARRDHHARLVTFDPRCSTTASMSDEWIPLRPGTDGLVALAMARVILEEGLEDREFLASHADVDGEQLKRGLNALDIERVCNESGVGVSTVQRLARGFASTGRGAAVFGSGVTGHENGLWQAKSVLLLNMLTGNIERRGGYCRSRSYEWDDLSPRPAGNHVSSLPGTLFWDLEHGHEEVGALFTFQANPAYEDPESRRTEEILRSEEKIPFHVAMDSCMSETVLLADIVLPSCTYLERWGLSSGPAMDQVPYVSLTQPAVSPCGDSRSLEDVLTDLARRLGGDVERYFPFQGAQDYYQGVVRNINELETQGGWSLLTKKGFWARSGEGNASLWTNGPRFPIKGSRYMLLPALSHGVSEGMSLLPGNLSLGEKALLLFSVPTHEVRTAGCKWLSEIQYASLVWINPRAADELGLKEGDWVRLRSSVGEIRARIRLTEGIHPGAVAIEDTGGHLGFGPLARGVAYSSQDPDTMLVWWQKGVYGENPRSIIAWSKDPHSQGPRWMDTVVRIEKI